MWFKRRPHTVKETIRKACVCQPCGSGIQKNFRELLRGCYQTWWGFVLVVQCSHVWMCFRIEVGTQFPHQICQGLWRRISNQPGGLFSWGKKSHILRKFAPLLLNNQCLRSAFVSLETFKVDLEHVYSVSLLLSTLASPEGTNTTLQKWEHLQYTLPQWWTFQEVTVDDLHNIPNNTLDTEYHHEPLYLTKINQYCYFWVKTFALAMCHHSLEC